MPRKQLINGEWVKVCSRADCHMAGIPQPIEGFHKDKSKPDMLEYRCKKCMKARGAAYRANNRERELARFKAYRDRPEVKERKKVYYTNNRERILAQQAEHYANNRERLLAQQAEYYARPEVKERKKVYGSQPKVKARKKAYYSRPDVKERNNQRERRRRRDDPKYRLRCNVSSSIWAALKRRGKTKGGRTFDHLPYTPKELMEHIEKQFDEHMTWENHGSYWHLDHIKPHASYKYDSLTDPEFQECWALENLRPLEASENIRKNSFYEGKRYYYNEAI